MRWRLVIAISINLIVGVGVALWLFATDRGYARLRNAQDLRGAWELGGFPSEVGIDIQRLLRDPRGAILFKKLFGEAAPAARVYGLCGLFHRNRAAFDDARRVLARDPRPVRLAGCFSFERKVRDLVDPNSSTIEHICENLRMPPLLWAKVELYEGYRWMTGR